MTRPLIIRADTIDLQDRDAPTAQVHLKPVADRLLAPHQADTLREVAAETAEEEYRSPRISWTPGGTTDLDQYADADPYNNPRENSRAISGRDNAMQTGSQQDALAIAQNGGVSGVDADDGDLDGETEVDMDDDMMDKISSSPSIEDGGFVFKYFAHCVPGESLLLFNWRHYAAGPPLPRCLAI
ncbi:hypothetical protein B0H67DRAFT_284415 [Lasiosphaeris hirsuta]|uniref:Uncharacterized protein n=1 Tax=Lasiosphaeris hirsuta TaxID=260670 RepID=A0AA40A8K0_9PEZI|nr:hypothetical protein B0H67DRAFT_284415 [Lasiosphaeris hirsuta]